MGITWNRSITAPTPSVDSLCSLKRGARDTGTVKQMFQKSACLSVCVPDCASN